MIEISSESDCSDVEAFDTNLAPQRNKQNISGLQTQPQIGPIFLSCEKTSKRVSNPKRRPETLEVQPSDYQESNQSFFVPFLRDLQAANPTFPICQVFSSLQKKACLQLGQNLTPNVKENTKQDSNGERSSITVERATTSPISTSTPPEKPQRSNRLSRTRRLKNENGKVDLTEVKSDCQSPKTSVVYHRERFSEDVLWTDKYSPVHSTEVVGNRDAIEQLHSWLKKWKLRSDVVERMKHKEMLNEQQSNDCWDCGDFVDEVGKGDEKEEQLCNTVLLTGPPGVGKTASVYACAMELSFKVFEVNCSSQRSGQEVLAQLKEATQSHLVETPGTDTLKPAFFNSSSTVRRSPKYNTLPVKTLKKTMGSTSKNRTGQKRCKKKENTITLTSYFKTKAKADFLYHSGRLCEKSAKKCDPAVCAVRKPTLSKTMATSLILFEEIDVVSESDVGFLAAVKSFMKTTKRPVILTTTDPLFRERFSGDLDEIIFQTPSMADVCSFLQLVCLAENIQLDSDDVSTLFTVTRGDVRRCLLQLQFWANSGGSWPTGQGSHRSNEREFDYKSCSANMLGLQSVSQTDLLRLLHEQQIIELIQPMVESWRNGFPMLYSNLELLLHVDTREHPFSALDKIMCSCPVSKMPFCPAQQMEITPSQYSNRSDAKTKSRLSRKKCIPSLATPSADTNFLQTGTSLKTECSADIIETTNNLGALSDFFDLMSFVDASMPLAQELMAPCQVENFLATEAKILCGHLDEMREEEDKSQENILDIRATMEALGFLRCKNSSQRGEASFKRGAFHALSNTRNISFVSCPNIIHQRRIDLGKKVLSSRFSQLHNTRAVCTDYLPVIRLICRTHRKRQRQRTEELVKYVKSFRTQLGLENKTVHLLAGEFS